MFKELHLNGMSDASKWGLTDFYPEAEAKLREAIAGDDDFTTGWFSCKKECRYATYTREKGKVFIAVACCMDDLFEEDDLIYDALWETTKIEKELPKEIIESIRDWAIDAGISDQTELNSELPGTATFDDIVKETRDLEYEAEANNHRMYQDLCECVKGHVEYMKENNIPFVEDEKED